MPSGSLKQINGTKILLTSVTKKKVHVGLKVLESFLFLYHTTRTHAETQQLAYCGKPT